MFNIHSAVQTSVPIRVTGRSCLHCCQSWASNWENLCSSRPLENGVSPGEWLQRCYCMQKTLNFPVWTKTLPGEAVQQRWAGAEDTKRESQSTAQAGGGLRAGIHGSKGTAGCHQDTAVHSACPSSQQCPRQAPCCL